MTLATITTALDELRAGRPIIVVDDENRENEGDIVMSAQLATPEWIAWTIRYTSGYLCAPMTNDRASQLNLPLMVQDNKDVRRTAYTITVDAAEGVTTGISAADRARTLHVLANPHATPDSIIRPGHIVPLRAVAGGVRERPGHTEATVELLQLAGLEPVGVIGEITNDDGTMTRLPELIEFGRREGIVVISIADLIEHLGDAPLNTAPESQRYHFEVETNVPTTHGTFRIRSYSDRTTGVDHLAIISGEPANGALVRLHSECLTGEALGSLKCECGPQLDAALDAIDREGGVVIYLRGHEGRAIGLTNKLRAYRLQEQGLDTYDANIALGLPADAREYGVARKILDDLGIDTVRLLSNNPDKRRQLIDQGIRVPELVPLIVGVGDVNVDYLSVKRDRMGHEFPDNLEPDFTV